MMRQVALDTETTGLVAYMGHRITEIGCVEIIDGRVTEKQYHVYLNPERELDPKSALVTGLTYDMLKDKQKFADVVDDFIGYIGNSELVIHNAKFDISFINAELERLHRPELTNAVTDTMVFARQTMPVGQRSLEALCNYYNVQNRRVDKHGALIDAQMLADVFVKIAPTYVHCQKRYKYKDTKYKATKRHQSAENTIKNDLHQSAENTIKNDYTKMPMWYFNEYTCRVHMDFVRTLNQYDLYIINPWPASSCNDFFDGYFTANNI
jgi:DNA polymerase-3 subunit epsilon